MRPSVTSLASSWQCSVAGRADAERSEMQRDDHILFYILEGGAMVLGADYEEQVRRGANLLEVNLVFSLPLEAAGKFLARENRAGPYSSAPRCTS